MSRKKMYIEEKNKANINNWGIWVKACGRDSTQFLQLFWFKEKKTIKVLFQQWT